MTHSDIEKGVRKAMDANANVEICDHKNTKTTVTESNTYGYDIYVTHCVDCKEVLSTDV